MKRFLLLLIIILVIFSFNVYAGAIATGCYDSDGGVKHKVAGVVTGYDKNGHSVSFPDLCSGEVLKDAICESGTEKYAPPVNCRTQYGGQCLTGSSGYCTESTSTVGNCFEGIAGVSELKGDIARACGPEVAVKVLSSACVMDETGFYGEPSQGVLSRYPEVGRCFSEYEKFYGDYSNSQYSNKEPIVTRLRQIADLANSELALKKEGSPYSSTQKVRLGDDEADTDEGYYLRTKTGAFAGTSGGTAQFVFLVVAFFVGLLFGRNLKEKGSKGKKKR